MKIIALKIVNKQRILEDIEIPDEETDLCRTKFTFAEVPTKGNTKGDLLE